MELHDLSYHRFLTPNLIWSIEQNKPSLVVKDLQTFGIPEDVVHSILLARGVYKWFSVRRKLIKLKNDWKKKINEVNQSLVLAKFPNNAYKIGYLRGYLRAYEECRKSVRALCHSSRWQAPDFDSEALEHLERLERTLKP